ncbi:DDE-type integrase/transposase/recombinase [Methylobacter sp.]|uniref:DDE-type integrase/transposase/recombinase n=1 Tax=Methylobacter sp. TaxID=2051955 RepID=UPI002FDD626A
MRGPKRLKKRTKKVSKKQLEAKAVQLFDENKQVYGSRRLSEAFIKEDIQVERYKTRQLIRKLGLKPRYPKRFKITTDSDHHEAISPNHLNKQFDVAAPNTVWTTDITYVWMLEGWLYVAIVIDLFSRQVVGWPIEDHLRTSRVSMPCRWHFGGENPSMVYSIILIGAVNTQARNTEHTGG